MRRSHGWTPRSLRRHYPHQVQGVVPLPDLSAIRLPRSICFRIRLARCKSMPRRIVAAFVPNAESSRGAWHKRLYNYGSLLLAPWLFSLPFGCRLFHIGVENRLPSALCHFPNRSGIEGAGGIFSIIGPFDNDLVGAHDRVSSNRNDVEIADGRSEERRVGKEWRAGWWGGR